MKDIEQDYAIETANYETSYAKLPEILEEQLNAPMSSK